MKEKKCLLVGVGRFVLQGPLQTEKNIKNIRHSGKPQILNKPQKCSFSENLPY